VIGVHLACAANRYSGEKEVCARQGRLAIYKEMRVWPNPACSGHGFAVRQSRRFPAKKLSPAKLLDKHAVPLTPSLGKGLRRKRAEGEKK